MSLKLNFLLQIDISGDFLWITDSTGEYSVNNEEGWGAPNPELNQSCLVAQIVRRAEDDVTEETADVPLVNVNANIVFNAGATNSDVNQFQFEFDRDGHHLATLFRLPVSTDGIFDLELNTLIEGTYFYWVTPAAVYRIVNGTPVLIEDLNEMVGDPATVQTTCQDVFMPLLIGKKTAFYQAYKNGRAGACTDDDNFNASRELQSDIQGADYQFRSGLTTEAENNIDNLLKAHAL